MAVAVSQATEARAVTRPERKLAWLLRLYALLCVGGAVAFLLRPDDVVRDIDRLGLLLRLPTLMATGYPVVSDFWLAMAIGNMMTLATCAWIAAGDVRRRRALVYPIIVSNVVAAAVGILLFMRWSAALPFLAIAIVDLPIAAIFLAALRAAPVDRT
jgi:hypothetical protein